jgi:hypothetical protein
VAVAALAAAGVEPVVAAVAAAAETSARKNPEKQARLITGIRMYTLPAGVS